MPYVFDHERLEVYQVARRLNREVALLVRELPKGSAESADNVLRSSKSIVRNTAEGCGRWKPKEKIHFYQIARASATECGASLDELVDVGYTTEERIAKAKQLAWRVTAMLVGMIKSVEEKARKRKSEQKKTQPQHPPRPRPRVPPRGS